MLASDPTLARAARARVSYVAVGATSDPALLKFPPHGYAPFERRQRVGFGERRWAFAVDVLMTWDIKAYAGFRVDRLVAGDPDTDATYAAGGESYAAPGETAVLRFLGLPLREPVRVLSVIDEERRKGFTYGTLPGHPLEGEEQLSVEWADDGGVWFVVRSFAKSANWKWRLLSPALWVIRRIVIIRYADALARKI